MIKRDRITLRHMRESDLPLYSARRANPSQFDSFVQTRITSPNAIAKRFAEDGFASETLECLMICNEHEVVIGQVNHFVERRYGSSREIGWVIYHPEHRGQGYATEAVRLLIDYLFGSYEMNRLECCTSPDNVASIRLAEKVGLTREGVLRELVLIDGEYHDGVVFSILRSEWRARRMALRQQANGAPKP